MKYKTTLSLAFVVFAFSATIHAATNELGWTLDSALKQIGRQGEDFQTALSDLTIEWKDSEGTLTRTGSGRMYIKKGGSIRLHVTDPEERVILVSDSGVQDYDPVRAIVETYSFSKHPGKLEQFAGLGFTLTGKDLQDDFLITLLGEDRIGDQRVLGLELTPKKESKRQQVSRITLWIDQGSWMPARQIIEHVAGSETLTVNYVGTARNLNLNNDLFKDNWPRGTQRVRR